MGCDNEKLAAIQAAAKIKADLIMGDSPEATHVCAE
jgi:hypothetical protein